MASRYEHTLLRWLFRPDRLVAEIKMLRTKRDMLREALEDIRNRSAKRFTRLDDPFTRLEELGNIHQIADDALAKDAARLTAKQKSDSAFMEALKVCEEGLKVWRENPNNKRWWKRIDGTPIPNDLLCCIAEALATQKREVK